MASRLASRPVAKSETASSLRVSMSNGTTPGQFETTDEILQKATDVYGACRAFFCNPPISLPGFLASFLAGVPATIVIVGSFIFTGVLWTYINVFGTLFHTIFEAIDQARRAIDPEVGQLAVDVLNELFGGTLSASDLSMGVSPGDSNARAFAVGKKFRDSLINEFVPGGQITPQSGYNAAAIFAGYAVNFAVATAFLDILADALSFGHFEEFKEIGVSATRNLGLGRMQARSWRAVIDQTINLPAQRYLLNQYRTTLPAEAQIVQLRDATLITDSDARLWLSYLGWPDALMNPLFQYYAKRLPHSTIWRLVRYGVMQLSDAQTYVMQQGYSADVATLLLTDEDLQRADTHTDALIAFYQKSFVEGFIDAPTWANIQGTFPIGAGEAKALAQLAGNMQETPRKALTEAQGAKALLENVIDLDSFTTDLANEGYSPDDSLTLQILALIAAGRNAEAIQVAQFKYNAAVAKAKAANGP